MVIVGKEADGDKGDIIVDPSVTHPTQPALEGLFLAEHQFHTGASDRQLYVRGSVVAWEGVVLERNLGDANQTTPGELFEYAPELLSTYPRNLTRTRVNWKEVAP